MNKSSEEILDRSYTIRTARPDILEYLFESQNRICDLCGQYIDYILAASIDHSTPVIVFARGDMPIEEAIIRANALTNLRAVHSTCNSAKSSMTREEWFASGKNKTVGRTKPFDLVAWQKQNDARVASIRTWRLTTTEGRAWCSRWSITMHNPENFAKQQAVMLALWDTEEFRAAHSAGCLAAQQRPEEKDRKQRAMKEVGSRPSFVRKMTAINRERVARRNEHPTWNKNQRDGIAKRTTTNTEWRTNTAAENKRKAEDPAWLAANRKGAKKAAKTRAANPEWKASIKAAMQRPEVKEKHRLAMVEAAKRGWAKRKAAAANFHPVTHSA